MFHKKELDNVYQAMAEGPTFISYEGKPFTPIEARRQYLMWLTQIYPNGRWSYSEPGVRILRANSRVHVIDIKDKEPV